MDARPDTGRSWEAGDDLGPGIPVLQGDLRSPASGRQIVAGHLSDWAKRRHWQECRLEPSALWCFEMRWVGDIYIPPSPEGAVAGFSVAECLVQSKALDVLLQANWCRFQCMPSGRGKFRAEESGS